MNVGVMFAPVCDPDFPAGCYCAQVSDPGLTAHGPGVEDARAAALDSVRLWLAETQAGGEPIPPPAEVLFSTLGALDHALQNT